MSDGVKGGLETMDYDYDPAAVPAPPAPPAVLAPLAPLAPPAVVSGQRGGEAVQAQEAEDGQQPSARLRPACWAEEMADRIEGRIADEQWRRWHVEGGDKAGRGRMGPDSGRMRPEGADTMDDEDYEGDNGLVGLSSGDEPWDVLDEILPFDKGCVRPGDIVETYGGHEHTVAYVFLEGVVTKDGDLVEWPDIASLRHAAGSGGWKWAGNG